jgi:hypothetical protein
MHDSFAAIWHVEPESDRPKLACDGSGELEKKAAELAASKAPEGTEAAAWRKATVELVNRIGDVGKTCAAKGDVNKSLTSAHEALHAVFKLIKKG